MTDESVIGGLAAELERSLEAPEAGAEPAAAPADSLPGTAEERRSLLADAHELGLFGVLVAASDTGGPVEEVHAEIPRKVEERLRAQLAEDGGGAFPAEVRLQREGAEPPGAGLPLPALVKLFHERKGGKSRLVLRKTVENAIFDFYDLKDHGLFIDDVGRILDVLKSAIGSTDNAQTFMKRLAALSNDTAKFILGTFPEQLALIYKISNREAERAEIDAAFDMFAPKVIWKRVFAIAKTLLQKEKRFRLALTVWSRLHGIALGREEQAKLETYLAIKDVKELVRRSIARAAERRALLEFRRAHLGTISALEAAF